jgi:hypothetical protein
MWINPHRVEGGYNGVECDRQDPSATLRHFFGTDINKAIHESGHFNGRSRDDQLVQTLVGAAIATLGPVREVYLLDRNREVTASFGGQVENRLWISSGKVHSRGKVHELQYLDVPQSDLWRLDLTDAPRKATSDRPRASSSRHVCPACYVALPLAAVESCPNCGTAVAATPG